MARKSIDSDKIVPPAPPIEVTEADLIGMPVTTRPRRSKAAAAVTIEGRATVNAPLTVPNAPNDPAEDIVITPEESAQLAALIPFQSSPRLDTVNLQTAMAGLSVHTRRAYQRWIKQYLSDVAAFDSAMFRPDSMPVSAAITALGSANLKAWLGRLKSNQLGKQSIGQAKASVIWLAQLLADMERVEYNLAAGLSRVKSPRAESGQRTGSWLTIEEVRHLLRGARASAKTPPASARNASILALLAMCGLRRDEITRLKWGDIQRQGKNRILAVHGKGAKRRQIKLAPVVADTVESWRTYHPDADNMNAIIFTQIRKSGAVTTHKITDKAVRLIVQLATDAAGLPGIAPHDLRRSFARGAYEAGASFELIRQSLGHSNVTTTERYVNSALELDHAATDIWADVLSDE
jgi:site-specific recombinase XerD